MQIDYLNLENSVKIHRQNILLNKGAVTVEVHTQLRNTLSNREIKMAIINQHNDKNKHNGRNDHKPNTCFRCGSKDNFT